MAARLLIAFAVVLAGQMLAGCGMPGKGDVAREARSDARKADLALRDARLRRQVEKGTFGAAQLFPGGNSVDARHLPPLPRTSAVAVVSVPAPRAKPAETQMNQPMPMQLASATAAGSGTCVYKPVMSDADIEACR
jgi:hypothetical protein